MLASSPAVSRKVFQHLPMSVGFRRGLPCLLSTIMLVAVIQGKYSSVRRKSVVTECENVYLKVVLVLQSLNVK